MNARDEELIARALLADQSQIDVYLAQKRWPELAALVRFAQRDVPVQLDLRTVDLREDADHAFQDEIERSGRLALAEQQLFALHHPFAEQRREFGDIVRSQGSKALVREQGLHRNSQDGLAS